MGGVRFQLFSVTVTIIIFLVVVHDVVSVKNHKCDWMISSRCLISTTSSTATTSIVQQQSLLFVQPFHRRHQYDLKRTTKHYSITDHQQRNHDIATVVSDDKRRHLVTKWVPTLSSIILTTTTTTTALTIAPKVAYSMTTTTLSDDRLFKPNPLTNPILEQIRIWEQAEADNIKYGGELERGDAGNKGKVDAYPKLLLPILQISYELEQVSQLIRSSEKMGRSSSLTTTTESPLVDAITILKQPKYEKIQFKRIFNAYADNIYYSDPDRANLYLAGGALPKTEQSLAYLLRNEILTSIENLQAELDYIVYKNPSSDREDLLQYASDAVSGMEQYLQIVPPNELLQAKRLFENTTTTN